MSTPWSYGRPSSTSVAATNDEAVSADCSLARPVAQAAFEHAHADGPVARCKGPVRWQHRINTYRPPGPSSLVPAAVVALRRYHLSQMAAPPPEISAPPHAGFFGSAHPPPLPPAASSAPPPPRAPAPGVSRPARKLRGPKIAKKSKKPVVKPGKKPTKKPGRKPVVKLTGIIPRPPIPAPTLNAAGERVLVCPVPRHLCGLEQKNARRPVDMERHLNSHFPPASGAKPHLCKGLPVEEFSEDLFKGLPEKLKEIRLGDDGDVAFVGGCGRRYARPDSLMRHARGCLSKKYCALVYLDDDDGSA